MKPVQNILTMGMTVKEKIDVSNSEYKYFFSASMRWQTRPIFETPHEHVCNSCSRKNKLAFGSPFISNNTQGFLVMISYIGTKRGQFYKILVFIDVPFSSAYSYDS